MTSFKLLLKLALRDRISLGWALLFPLGLMIAMNLFFDDPVYRTRLLAGLLAISSLFYIAYGMAFDVLGQRNRGVYKLLRITPVRTPVFIIRLALARSVVALGCTLFVLAAGLVILRVPFHVAGLPMLFVVLALGMVAFTFLGFMIGNLGNEESGVATLTNVVTLPLLFLTETFYSLESAPVWVQVLRDALPFNHFLNAIRVCLEGNPSAAALPLLIVLGYGVLFLGLSTLTFRWDAAAPIGGRLTAWLSRKTLVFA